MLLEDLGHLASKLFGRPVQRTRSAQDARECSLFLEPHLASRTALQVCTKSLQFRAAEFIVEIAQKVNSVIARIHSAASRVPIVGIHRVEHPDSDNIPMCKNAIDILVSIYGVAGVDPSSNTLL